MWKKLSVHYSLSHLGWTDTTLSHCSNAIFVQIGVNSGSELPKVGPSFIVILLLALTLCHQEMRSGM